MSFMLFWQLEKDELGAKVPYVRINLIDCWVRWVGTRQISFILLCNPFVISQTVFDRWVEYEFDESTLHYP